MKKIYYNLIISIILFIAVLIRILVYKNSTYFLSVDECHSLSNIDTLSFNNIFVCFTPGANFLPGYKAILKIIYSFLGLNFPCFKLFSLICGICSVFVFHRIILKLYNNVCLISTSLILFALNYCLIFYCFMIKNYELDVLITLIILNTAINIYSKYKDVKIPLTEIILYAVITIIFIYCSIPAIFLTELFWLILMFNYILKKNMDNVKRLTIFQIICIPFLIVEYYTYIIKMHTDKSLTGQWDNGNFFFTPSSLDAVNSLINFSYFKFYWFDKDIQNYFPDAVIILYIIIIIAGTVKFIIPALTKEHEITGLFVIGPVYCFIALSFLHLYPFCNRLITFLIPIFIIIFIKAFDMKNWGKIIGNICALLLVTVYIYLIFSYKQLYFLIIDNLPTQANKNLIERIKTSDTNQIFLSLEFPCMRCIENGNITYYVSGIEDNKLRITDKNDAEEYKVFLNDIIKNYKRIILIYRLSDNISMELNLLNNIFIREENYKITEKSKENLACVDYIIYEKE